jgi:methylated-DNA-[protein]-cysteine S-methyltransferase
MKKQQSAPFFSAIVAAPFGAVGIRCEAGAVSELVYLPPGLADQYAARLAAPGEPIAQLAADQVAHYLRDPDFAFDLPLAPSGSAFQQRVWQAISKLKRGQVRTYGEVARQLGTAARAVGQACGANRYPLIIPCHRVTAAGALGGFANHADAAGFHVGVKRWLLSHEGAGSYR